MTGALDDVLAGVGPRLRALRHQREITLAELTERTGVSQSTLSRLESGHRRPSLELLLPLSEAYGVPLDDLVGAPRTGDPRIHLKPIRRHGLTLIPLTRRAGGIQAYKMVLPKRRRTSPAPTLQTHEGHEWLYVLDGRLRLLLGKDEFVLLPGEAAEFDTTQPHALESAGDAVELLILFGVQGERAHVRSAPE